MPPGLTLTHSGLVIADPFTTATPNRQLLDHYVFNGSAAPGVGCIDASNRGLDVGVRAHSSWAGWFAVTLARRRTRRRVARHHVPASDTGRIGRR